MNRRQLFMPVAALTAAFAFAACGGSTATSAPTGAGATGAVKTAAAGATPTAAATSGVVPTVGPGGSVAVPTFAPDNDLAAKFPASIDGSPVSDVTTALFVDVMRGFGAKDTDVQAIVAAFNTFGVDFGKVSFGSASYEVDDDTVQLTALRTPGGDANKIIQNYSLLAGVFNTAPGATAEPVPALTQSNIGGKNITLATDQDGNVTFLYVSGDTLFSWDGTTDAQNTKIAAALP